MLFTQRFFSRRFVLAIVMLSSLGAPIAAQTGAVSKSGSGGSAASDDCPASVGNMPTFPIAAESSDPLGFLFQEVRYEPAPYGFSGSFFPLKFLTDSQKPVEPPQSSSNWYFTEGGQLPFRSAKPSTTQPNTFFVDQNAAIFDNLPGNLFEPGAEADFANRVVHMFGSVFSALGSFETGNNRTRGPVNTLQEPTPTTSWNKYVVGAYNSGVMLRGHTIYDSVEVIGTLNTGTTAFMNGITYENDDSSSAALRQIVAHKVKGAENDAWIGRIFASDDGTTHLTTAAQALNQGFHEDDYWDPAPADVVDLVGSENYAVIDNKKASPGIDTAIPGLSTAPYRSGYINQAVGLVGAVASMQADSWINLNAAIGMQSVLVAEGAFVADSPGYFTDGSGTDRGGSVIRNWTGVQVLAPVLDPCIDLINSTGVYVQEQSATSAQAGAPRLNSSLVNDDFAGVSHHTEHHAGLVTRGHMVVGEGWSDLDEHGYDTDVLHIRDVLHLTPRRSPPTIADDVPPSERVGLLYYDLSRNRVRVSLAGSSSGSDNEIIWADLKVDLSSATTVSSSSDSATATYLSSPADDPSNINAETSGRSESELQESVAQAATLARRGGSPFDHPRLHLNVSDSSDPAAVALSFTLDGFQQNTPRIFWRLVPHPRSNRGASAWREIAGSSLIQVNQSNNAQRAGGWKVRQRLSTALDLSGHPLDGSPIVPGQIVQFIAIHPETGQSAGASYRYSAL
jgi:hypothetical protein